jgi:hypothetical protein
VSDLVVELLLRMVKPAVALLLGALIYWVATGPLGEPGSVVLALLSWIAAAAFVGLLETGIV